ncbi:glycine/D-amino acid oxidase-like deaminating enzyme [Rhizobium sp. PP-F2F-G38]|uniref:NAD(P)/FAD-dependent oxidoreductase n=1 Tax=Rhizobium sp. PP-CC-3G-465 TaxID=2135648 RepID=UPI000D905619|nr:glycine/D-amino acid oxidase-like deaminating enzyme [Rhizobium sp. PP-CC-3A-592]PYE36262.1 glycine/D-amino acid oxidase-like deaminating enzyme [Rhizobium sp. PP-WC-1G-195]PYE99757.1 glycine/D-amino acid oxidase-like deaminating enzyme [Rhizobium sp. PP-F2F-G38]TCL96318.1 glycine/D-amino acid oxidase-like deaminating enzyme [Rhizobium sp. PP-WC-2G-219]TCQ29178.1 glycine/D-amino acid oxidase-like deaminating enzyme [Rhizobium sp. PP-CC-3G-465]
MKTDVAVLGAGIVGLSTAIHLARRGKSVLLVDRRGAGEETSFGNAGLIQREGVVPYGFPHDFGALFRYALNNTIDAHYHLKALPGLVPFLVRYWWNSGFTQHQHIARLYAPLIENSITEHADLIKASGADNLIQRDGWMKVFRTDAARDAAYKEAERLSAGFGVNHQKLSPSDVKALEPSIRIDLAGGLRWTDPWSIRDPHSLNKAYLTYFQSLGGRLVAGDAATLEHVLEGPGWRIASPDGPIEAAEVVVALGPWADTVTRKLGYRYPLAVKRGYHMHYGTQEGERLNNWVLDAEKGYFLAPMLRGIRLTTGAEFATRDAPKTPVQLARAERVARDFFPLAERRDEEPWMGARPCTPDMMPIIGKAPRHEGLWFAFGHAHHGMTLGPVTGRALAEKMTGERTTIVDLGPYRPERFVA